MPRQAKPPTATSNADSPLDHRTTGLVASLIVVLLAASYRLLLYEPAASSTTKPGADPVELLEPGLDDWLLRAQGNVLLCDTDDGCGWAAYERFLVAERLTPFDEAWSASGSLTANVTTLTEILSMPLAIVRGLQLALGPAAFKARTEPVVIDIAGWSCWWRRRNTILCAWAERRRP